MKYILSLFLLCLHFSAFADVLVLSNRPLYDLLNDLKTSHLELRLIAQQSSTHRQEIRPAEIKIIDEADIFLLIKPFDNSIEKIAKNQKKPILIANDLSSHILPLRHHTSSLSHPRSPPLHLPLRRFPSGSLLCLAESGFPSLAPFCVIPQLPVPFPFFCLHLLLLFSSFLPDAS